MSEPYTNVWSFREGRTMGMHFQPKVNMGFDNQRELILMMPALPKISAFFASSAISKRRGTRGVIPVLYVSYQQAELAHQHLPNIGINSLYTDIGKRKHNVKQRVDILLA